MESDAARANAAGQDVALHSAVRNDMRNTARITGNSDEMRCVIGSHMYLGK